MAAHKRAKRAAGDGEGGEKLDTFMDEAADDVPSCAGSKPHARASGYVTVYSLNSFFQPWQAKHMVIASPYHAFHHLLARGASAHMPTGVHSYGALALVS